MHNAPHFPSVAVVALLHRALMVLQVLAEMASEENPAVAGVLEVPLLPMVAVARQHGPTIVVLQVIPKVAPHEILDVVILRCLIGLRCLISIRCLSSTQLQQGTTLLLLRCSKQWGEKRKEQLEVPHLVAQCG